MTKNTKKIIWVAVAGLVVYFFRTPLMGVVEKLKGMAKK